MNETNNNEDKKVGIKIKDSVGQRLRTARENKGLTLDELALETGLTKSFLSQVERGKSNPSLESLRIIVQKLNIPMVTLFENTGEDLPKVMVKKNKRKNFSLPDSILKFELLCPDLKRQMEIVRVLAPPGGKSEYMTHEGEEWGYVLHGSIRLTVGNEELLLEEGDTAYFSSKIPHGWVNESGDKVELIWVITPPSF